tara:strand:- start:6829 stop:7443 length:615 start_codon:yes stop_codon:yes gene_type:complete
MIKSSKSYKEGRGRHLPSLLQAVRDLDYTVFEYGTYDLNIIGVRKEVRDDVFCDDLYVAYLYDSMWRIEFFECTTVPTVRYLLSPVNSKGAAVLVPGQYSQCYRVGKHRGRDALVQVGPVYVARDDDRDPTAEIDGKHIEEGKFGINLHDWKGGEKSASAGCQVLRDAEAMERILNLCQSQIELHGWHSFTYTLIEEKDLRRSS